MWLSNQRLTLPPWNTKTSADPAAVSPHVSSVPIRDCTIGWYPLNILTICIQCNNGFRTRPRSTEGLVPRLTAAVKTICTGWDGQDWPVSIGKGQLLLDCLDAFSGLWSIYERFCIHFESCSLVPSLHSDWGLVYMRLLASYGASVVTCSVFPQKFL